MLLLGLTLLFQTLVCTSVRAQCDNPDIVQVIEFQRAAQVLLTVPEEADSVQIYIGDISFTNPQSTPDSIATFTGFPYNVYGLEPGVRYNFFARAFCGGVASGFSGRQGFRTDADGPAPNDVPADDRILASATFRCGFDPGTTRAATGPDGEPACGGIADDDVWYSLRTTHPAYRIQVRPVGGTDQDVAVEVIDLAGNNIACSDAAGAGFTETIELFNVPDRTDYRIRVYTPGATGYAIFETCAVRLDVPISDSLGCVVADVQVLNGDGTPGELVDFLAPDGGLVLSLENTNDLGEVNVSYLGVDGPLREADGSQNRYVNRNVSITVEQQPTTPVQVRLYLSMDDVNEFIAAGALSGIDQIAVTKTLNSVCSPNYPGSGDNIQVAGYGPFGDGFFVDLSVSSFSEFFFHASDAPLEMTDNVTELQAGAGWRVFPNPTKNHLFVTGPEDRTAQRVRLLDVTGKTVLAVDGPGRRIELGALPSGVYQLVVETEAGAFGRRVLVD